MTRTFWGESKAAKLARLRPPAFSPDWWDVVVAVQGLEEGMRALHG